MILDSLGRVFIPAPPIKPNLKHCPTCGGDHRVYAGGGRWSCQSLLCGAITSTLLLKYKSIGIELWAAN